MIRLFHSADWHLGQTLHGFDRAQEHEIVLEAMLRIIETERVDAVLLAGDIYHVANPPVLAQRAFFDFIRKLAERAPQTELVVIAGNHDSGPRLELPEALGVGDRVRILGAPPRNADGPDPSAAVLALRDAEGAPRAALIALPYPRPGDLYGLADSGASEPRAFMSEAAAHARRAYPGLPIIVATHLHVRGGEATEASERPILIGGEDAISLQDFPPDAAYVALGHLHRPQTLKGAPLAAYSGPPIPLSVDEAANEQGVCIVDVAMKGGVAEVDLRRVALPRPRGFLRAPEQGASPLPTLERELAALASRLKDDPSAAAAPPFLEVAVTLDGPAPDLRRRIETALDDAPARLVRIRRFGVGGDRSESSGEASPPEPPSPSGAFAELYARRYDTAPPDALSAAFAALLQSVLDEEAASPPPAGGEDREDAGAAP